MATNVISRRRPAGNLPFDKGFANGQVPQSSTTIQAYGGGGGYSPGGYAQGGQMSTAFQAAGGGFSRPAQGQSGGSGFDIPFGTIGSLISKLTGKDLTSFLPQLANLGPIFSSLSGIGLVLALSKMTNSPTRKELGTRIGNNLTNLRNPGQTNTRYNRVLQEQGVDAFNRRNTEEIIRSLQFGQLGLSDTSDPRLRSELSPEVLDLINSLPKVNPSGRRFTEAVRQQVGRRAGFPQATGALRPEFGPRGR